MTDLDRRFVLAGAVAAAAMPAAAAPKARRIPGPWQTFGTGPAPDYGPWAGFLDRYVVTSSDGVNRVRYSRARQDGATLDRIVAQMAQTDLTNLGRADAMAFWINLYNAVTVALVLEDWPVASIKEVRGGLFNTGPWSDAVVTVAGQRLSLDDIEHGILRPVFRDPRIHYGVNCASIGCPNLVARPWTGDGLDARLDAAARDYVTHPRGAAQTSGGLVLSSIYDWFAEDFGGDETGVLAHLNAYAETPLRGPVARYAYDWSINAI